jgi:hypothetical protein
MEAEYTIQEVQGSWQRAGDANYQVRRAGGKRPIAAYVRWYAYGWPQCLACDANRCEQITAVRAWRKQQKAKAG